MLLFILHTIFSLIVGSSQDIPKDLPRVYSSKGKRVTYQPPNFMEYPVNQVEGFVMVEAGIYRNFDYDYRDGKTIFYIVCEGNVHEWHEEQLAKIDESLVTSYIGKDSLIQDSLSRLSFEELSKDFGIYVYHIPKEYLIATPDTNLLYKEAIPRIEYVYFLVYSNNQVLETEVYPIDREWPRTHLEQWETDLIISVYEDRFQDYAEEDPNEEEDHCQEKD